MGAELEMEVLTASTGLNAVWVGLAMLQCDSKAKQQRPALTRPKERSDGSDSLTRHGQRRLTQQWEEIRGGKHVLMGVRDGNKRCNLSRPVGEHSQQTTIRAHAMGRPIAVVVEVAITTVVNQIGISSES